MKVGGARVPGEEEVRRAGATREDEDWWSQRTAPGADCFCVRQQPPPPLPPRCLHFFCLRSSLSSMRWCREAPGGLGGRGVIAKRMKDWGAGGQLFVKCSHPYPRPLDTNPMLQIGVCIVLIGGVWFPPDTLPFGVYLDIYVCLHT
jgi:hypothetical protein